MIIEIYVKLVGNLKKYSLSGDDVLMLDLPEPVTADTVINCLQVNPQEVGLVIVNNAYTDLDAKLTPGSEVKLFPLLTGG